MIRICSNHPEYEVPLIWTFAFPYAEYWCPYCGAKYGMLGAGKLVPLIDELEQRHKQYKAFSDEFLHANGVQVCVSTLWEGERIKPERLPQHEKDRLQKVISDWKYEVKIEDISPSPTPEEK